MGRVSVALGAQVTDADIFAATSDGIRTVFVDACRCTSIATISTAPAVTTTRTTPSASRSSPVPRWSGRATESPYDVIHAHDWQAGLVPVLLRTVVRRPPVARDGAGGFHDP